MERIHLKEPIIKNFLIVLILLLSSPALAAPTCSVFLGAVLSSSLNVSAFNFKKKRDVLSVYDGGKRVGFIQYGYVDAARTLYIGDIEINPEYQGLKLSKIFLEKALAEFPASEQIESILVGTNEEVYIERKRALVLARNEGRARPEDGLEAVKLTPAYKIRVALGFPRILDYSRAEDHIVLVVGRETRD